MLTEPKPAGHASGQKLPWQTEMLNSVAVFGTYLPRRCGIATFSNDLVRAITAQPGGPRVSVVAMNNTAPVCRQNAPPSRVHDGTRRPART
jgi:hypothetical protein